MSAVIIDIPRFRGTRCEAGVRGEGVLTPEAPRSGAGQPRLRLTRRGRVVLAIVVALPLAVGVGVASGSGDGAVATGASFDSSFEYVQVEAGQSLWEIASAVAPAEDPRDVVSEIVRLNGLSTSDVFPGQQLGIPDRYRS